MVEDLYERHSWSKVLHRTVGCWVSQLHILWCRNDDCAPPSEPWLTIAPFEQMVVDIIHPGRANVPKSELQEVVGGMYKADSKLVVLFGFRTKYGGGKSTGFCLIYENENAMRKFEPKYRLVRQGLAEKKEKSRKAIKEAKNKAKKVRGTGASIAKHKAKRAAGED